MCCCAWTSKRVEFVAPSHGHRRTDIHIHMCINTDMTLHTHTCVRHAHAHKNIQHIRHTPQTQHNGKHDARGNKRSSKVSYLRPCPWAFVTVVTLIRVICVVPVPVPVCVVTGGGGACGAALSRGARY